MNEQKKYFKKFSRLFCPLVQHQIPPDKNDSYYVHLPPHWYAFDALFSVCMKYFGVRAVISSAENSYHFLSTVILSEH